MNDVTSAIDPLPIRGRAAPIPPGIAAAAANDAAADFTLLLELALDPAATAAPPADAKPAKTRPAGAAAPEAIDLEVLIAAASAPAAAAVPLRAAPAAEPADAPDQELDRIARLGHATRALVPENPGAGTAGEPAPADGDAPHTSPELATRPEPAALPATPASAATPATPASASIPATPASAATPATPAAPGLSAAPSEAKVSAHAQEGARTGETSDRPPAPQALPTAELQVAANGIAAHAAAGASHAATLHVSPRVGHPGFDEAFAARVSVALRAGAETASISLNPPELGPVEMRVRVSNGEAHIVFAAEQPLTRDAINEALPRLREMLSAHGLELAGSSVGAQLPQREPSVPAPTVAELAPPLEDAAAAAPLVRAAEPRLVDTFV